jgi:hypothetical protein
MGRGASRGRQGYGVQAMDWESSGGLLEVVRGKIAIDTNWARGSRRGSAGWTLRYLCQ